MADLTKADWLAVAWQADGLQVWAMQGSSPCATARSTPPYEEGRNPLASATTFAAALRDLTGPWSLPARPQVFVCGLPMSGWANHAPRPVPCAAMAPAVQTHQIDGFDLNIIPGLRQAEPSGLTQGAETQIAGFLSLNGDWDGVICLPGATSVWAQISAGEVVSFQSFLTGALIEMLRSGAPQPESTALDDTAFDQALSDGLSRPERLAGRLASLRADHSLGLVPAPTAQARLAGTLIGAELAAAKPYWLGQTLAVIGPQAEAQLYLRALAQQSAPATEADSDRMMLAGITAVRRGLLKAG